MEIFYNRERPGYDEIVSYGPEWWTEYREMDANYQFAGWTLDLMAEFLERIVNNQFPAHADEATIRMYERLMNIEYDSEATLEERRNVISAYYSGTGKMSKSLIKDIIKKYSGLESDVYWQGDILQISIMNSFFVPVSIHMIDKILARRMPAHIAYGIFETRPITGTVYIGAAVQEAEIINISPANKCQ